MVWIIATFIFVILLVYTFVKPRDDWDITPIVTIPLLFLGYAVFWIIQLIVWNN